MNTVLAACYPILLLALALGFARLVSGPSLPDRVVALDLIGMIIAAFVGVYAMDMGQAVLMDFVVMVAVLLFLGTVAFARYLERRLNDDD